MIYNYFYSLIIVFSVLLFIFLHQRKNLNRVSILSFLYLYHIMFAFIYYQMTFTNNADSIQYYFDVLNNLKNYDFYFTYGTYFVKNVTYLLIKYLYMSYFNATLLFATWGYFGFYILFNMINIKKIGLSKYLVLIFFLPNIHFWTVGIGKDSFIILPLVLSLYSLKNKNILLLSLSIFLVFLVRPHIAFLMLVSLGFLSLFYSKIKFYQKIIISLIIIGVLFSIMNLLIQYIGLNDINITAIGDYIEQRQSYNTQGGSSIDIKNYNFLMKIFAFLYRPFFESSSILSLIVSVENVIYLFMTYFMIRYRKYINWSHVSLFGIIFIIVFIILMSNMTANLGIAVRQKTMLFPMFFYIFSLVLQNRRIKYAK